MPDGQGGICEHSLLSYVSVVTVSDNLIQCMQESVILPRYSGTALPLDL